MVMLTPNSDVSRNATIRANASSLAQALQRTVVEKNGNPVRVLFTDDGMSVWTHDIGKTMQVLITNAKVDSLKVKEPCVLLINADEFSNLLSRKFGDSLVQITTKPNEPINITTKDGGNALYHPADEDDCAIVPDRWKMPKNSAGWIELPQKDNEVCTSRITLSKAALEQGMVDMQVASAPYVVFSFSSKGSRTSSGHWGTKTNQSHTPISATVEGEDVEIGLAGLLKTIVSKLTTDEVVIHKHKDVPFIVMENDDTTIVAAETIKE